MAALERTYNIPLRKVFQKSPRYKRTNKAVSALKAFITRHMKSEEVKIGKHLNQFLWKDGIRNPPHHVKVQLIKEEDGIVKAELFGHKYEQLTKEEREKAADKETKDSKKKEIKEKVKKEPTLAEEAVKKQKEIKEEEKLGALSDKLTKEELDPHNTLEEEKDIKETIEEIKGTDKPKARKAKTSKKE